MSEQLPRRYEFNGMKISELPGGRDRYPTIQDVKKALAVTYNDLTTASVEGPEVKDGYELYTFKKAIGTKG